MRKEKQLLLDEIEQKIGASTAMIVTSYQKLEPNTSWALRDKLSQSGGIFEVVRKRVFLKAAEKAGIQLDESALQGHIGVVFVTQPDAMKSAKTMVKFSEENADLLTVVCGQIEGKVVPGAEVVMLAKLPGIEEMRSMFIGLLVSPMSHMLSVLDAAMAGPLSAANEEKTS